MSERTGIPLSTLSKVEHDRLTLTYDKLLQLSQRLNIRMSELFAEARRGAGCAGHRAPQHRPHRPRDPRQHAELRLLLPVPGTAPQAHDPGADAHPRESIAEFGELVHHSGEEYIHVLEGRVEIHTEFYDPIVLEAGESIYIDSNMGHAYVAAEGCDEALCSACARARTTA